MFNSYFKGYGKKKAWVSDFPRFIILKL